MKKAFGISCAVFSLLATAGLSQAQIITSIQFTRGEYGQGVPLTSSETAGIPAYAASDWNSETTYGSGQGNVQHDWSDNTFLTETNSVALKTSTGGASPITYSVGSYGNINDGTGFSSGSNNAYLMNGAAATATGINPNTSSVYNPVTLTLNGLSSSDTYEFIVYLSGGPSIATEGSIGLNGGATDFFLTPNGGYGLTPSSTFVAATQTSDFVAGNGGSGSFIENLPGGPQSYTANYATFTDTNATSATFTLNALGTYPNGNFVENAAGGNTPVGIAGIQIIDIAAVPEPSTWAIMLGGLGMLAFCVRRKAASIK
jgi:hypothetical protein